MSFRRSSVRLLLGVIIVIVGVSVYLRISRNPFPANMDVDILRAVALDVTYDDLFRYPEDYKGNAVVLRGVVSKVESSFLQIRLEEEGAPLVHVVRVKTTQSRDIAILEEDVVEVVGVTAGLYTSRSLLRPRVQSPRVHAYQISLLKKRSH